MPSEITPNMLNIEYINGTPLRPDTHNHSPGRQHPHATNSSRTQGRISERLTRILMTCIDRAGAIEPDHMSRTTYQQNPVSSVVWRWQEPVEVLADTPNYRKIHIIKGLVGLCIGLGVASFLFFKKDHPIPAAIIATISVSIATCALFIPSAFAKIDAFFQRLGNWVGQGLAYILLVPLFWLFFVPAHICMAIAGTDKLKLKYPSKEPTFWEPRPKVQDESYYRRQF